MLGTLRTEPAIDRPDLLAEPVAAALARWPAEAGAPASKLAVPGETLARWPGAVVLDDLARPA